MVAQMQHSAMITAGQIRAARALIGWTQVDLAKASGVSEISIKNIERGATDPRASTLEAFQRAFEKAGGRIPRARRCPRRRRGRATQEGAAVVTVTDRARAAARTASP